MVLFNLGMASEDLARKNWENSKIFAGGRMVRFEETYEETYENG